MKKLIALAAIVGLIVSCQTTHEGYPDQQFLDSVIVEFNNHTGNSLADYPIPEKPGEIDFIGGLHYPFTHEGEDFVVKPFVQTDDEEVNYLILKGEAFSGAISMEKLFRDRNYYKKR